MKPGIYRFSRISCAVACVLLPLAAGGVAADPVFSTSLKQSEQASESLSSYIILFEEPGLLYQSGADSARRPGHPLASSRLNVESETSRRYLDQLSETHASRRLQIETRLGRKFAKVFPYDIAFSGLGVEMTATEARSLQGIDGVRSVQPVRDQEIGTFRGPAFIGSDAIWSGASTPTKNGSRGQGTVIGVIDSGIAKSHPSFGELPDSCGVASGKQKLVAAYNCLSGVCTTEDEPGATCQSNSSGTAEDCSGHGTHVASTAGGNTLAASGPVPAPGVGVSGVADCAQIISYKVCATTSCNGLAIAAAINRAIADNVDVINFSISGGGGNDLNVWQPAGTSDRMFLDALNAGILVAASAGNTRVDNPTPEGDVNHRAPWVTSVAASSHDEVSSLPGKIDVTGPEPVPPGLAGSILLTPSSSPFDFPLDAQLWIMDFPGAPTGCAADPAYPDNYFNGGTALVARGGCTFSEKIDKAAAAGASSVIVYNNAPGTIGMGGLEGATVPAYSVSQTAGQALVAFRATLIDQPINAVGQPPRTQGDVLADFSLRGPITPVPSGAIGFNNVFDVTKPDITAPGIDIYAAVPGGYDYYNGTSMASPHIAGAYALMRSIRPSWSATEIRSALMMTAFNGGTREDGSTPWTPDDVGSGRADLTKAALAGLVMDETYGGFLAANPANGGDPRLLNLPSVRNADCLPECSWTRTVRNTLHGPSEWTAAGTSVAGAFNVTVEPANFSFTGAGIPAPDTLFADDFEEGEPAQETIEIVITATPTQDLTGQVAFGEVTLVAADDRSPDLRISMAVGQKVISPACLDVDGFTSNGTALSGDPNNTVINLPIGVGNELSGVGMDVRIEGFAPSWLADAALLFSSTPVDSFIVARPAANIETPGIAEVSQGVVLFSDLALPNVIPAADGILRLEWFEDFADAAVNPDSAWNNATNPSLCSGIRLVCTDQAACDQAVEAANN